MYCLRAQVCPLALNYSHISAVLVISLLTRWKLVPDVNTAESGLTPHSDLSHSVAAANVWFLSIVSSYLPWQIKPNGNLLHSQEMPPGQTITAASHRSSAWLATAHSARIISVITCWFFIPAPLTDLKCFSDRRLFWYREN